MTKLLKSAGLSGTGQASVAQSVVAEFIWHDREIRFDSNSSDLDCRPGEKVIDSIEHVEDTKGNNGERGTLLITNLRLIWFSEQN